MTSSHVRTRIGHWMRQWADRIDYRGAPRYTGYTFTFETGEGIRFRKDGKGCRLWYLGMDDYDKAHDEADSAPAAAARTRRLELIETAMTEPDPAKAGTAAAELREILLSGGQTKQFGPMPRIMVGRQHVIIGAGGGGGGARLDLAPDDDGPMPAPVRCRYSFANRALG
jgi:hypothetical protein